MNGQTAVIPVGDYAVIEITDSAGLMALCQRWANETAVLAVDCEFQRERTFYPIAGLFQICDGRAVYLIDPLTVEDFAPLIAVFANTQITKVLHSCAEDLEVFRVFLGVLPEPLFDTQIAAAFLGTGFSLSYRQLVTDYCGVNLDKAETRSDWLKRPLSAAQQHYAAEDVRYLLSIYAQQRASLEATGRRLWFEEDCTAIIAAARKEESPEEYYPKVKGAWRLDPSALAVLRELSQWRELEARRQDLPRRWLLSDQILCDLAARKPESIEELAEIKELSPKMINRHGKRLLALIQTGLACEPEARPAPLAAPLPPDQRNRMKALKSCVTKLAAELGVCEEILARKRDFETLVQSGLETGVYRVPDSLQGWRREIVGTRLLQVLTGEAWR